MRDKGLNQIATGVFEGRCAAELRRIGFNLGGIEVVLADTSTFSCVITCGTFAAKTKARGVFSYQLFTLAAGGVP